MSRGRYTVDSDDLADLIRRMSDAERRLEELTNDLERSLAVLHDDWAGGAARAQVLAHREWEKGLATMREALADLRGRSTVARENYLSAGDTNVSMWRGVQ